MNSVQLNTYKTNAAKHYKTLQFRLDLDCSVLSLINLRYNFRCIGAITLLQLIHRGRAYMLQLSYLGIAFAIVFYVVFGVAVRLMELSDRARNKARLGILITSLFVTFVSSLFAVVLNWREKKLFLFALFILLSGLSSVRRCRRFD